KHRFNFVSDRSVDLLGIAPNGLMNDPQLLRAAVHENDRAKLQDALSTVEPLKEHVSGFVVVRMQEGTRKVELRYRDTIGDDGTVLRRGLIQEAIETDDV